MLIGNKTGIIITRCLRAARLHCSTPTSDFLPTLELIHIADCLKNGSLRPVELRLKVRPVYREAAGLEHLHPQNVEDSYSHLARIASRSWIVLHHSRPGKFRGRQRCVVGSISKREYCHHRQPVRWVGIQLLLY